MDVRKAIKTVQKFHAQNKTGKEIKIPKRKELKNTNSLPKAQTWYVR